MCTWPVRVIEDGSQSSGALQKLRHKARWERIDLVMLLCFGALVTSHFVSVILLAVKGSTPAHYFSQAAFLASWCLVLASHQSHAPGNRSEHSSTHYAC